MRSLRQRHVGVGRLVYALLCIVLVILAGPLFVLGAYTIVTSLIGS